MLMLFLSMRSIEMETFFNMEACDSISITFHGRCYRGSLQNRLIFRLIYALSSLEKPCLLQCQRHTEGNYTGKSLSFNPNVTET